MAERSRLLSRTSGFLKNNSGSAPTRKHNGHERQESLRRLPCHRGRAVDDLSMLRHAGVLCRASLHPARCNAIAVSRPLTFKTDAPSRPQLPSTPLSQVAFRSAHLDAAHPRTYGCLAHVANSFLCLAISTVMSLDTRQINSHPAILRVARIGTSMTQV